GRHLGKCYLRLNQAETANSCGSTPSFPPAVRMVAIALPRSTFSLCVCACPGWGIIVLGGQVMPVLDFPISKKDWDNEIGARNGVSTECEERPTTDGRLWQSTIQKIISFQDLEEDWDDNGAKAPSRELLDSAVALACAFCRTGMEPPSRVVSGVT